MNKNGEMFKGFGLMFLVMLVSLGVASLWNSVPVISESVHSVLDPSLGALLDWNTAWGMTIAVLFIALITSLIQKFATDQEKLKELKALQKDINKRAKELKHDPEKMMEVQKELMPLTMEMFKLNSRSIIYTAIPFILLFRWFYDYFALIPDFRFFGFMTWFWFYLIFVMVFSGFIRKYLKIA